MNLSNISSYFKEKERNRLDAKVRSNADGLPEMTEDEIKFTCLENDGYQTPELNEKLYLHFKGYKRIENLTQYHGCKAIWLDSNGFTKIENLDSMQSLRSLYLSKNLISKIENIDNLGMLSVLDLSYNRITNVEGLQGCQLLESLNLSHNQLATPDSVRHLINCKSLTTLDLSTNQLSIDEGFIEIFNNMNALTTLSINGNELTKLPHFRKRMISGILQLGYLDRPIDEVERICALSFLEGGVSAETAARNAWKDGQTKKRQEEVQAYKIWQESHRATLRKQRESRNEPNFSQLEFSVEEQSERQQLIDQAVAEDRLIRQIGVEKVASDFWSLADQVNSTSADKDIDLLEQSLQLAVHNKEIEEIASEIEIGSINDNCIELNAIEPITAPFDDSSTAVPPPVGKVSSQVSSAMPDDIVGESMRIFKEKTTTIHPAQRTLLSNVTSAFDILDDNDTNIEANASGSSLYWTESMDRRLQDLVFQHRDSYEEIAEAMNIFIQSDQLTDDERKAYLSQGVDRSSMTPIAADTCRSRWSELDAAIWGIPDTQQQVQSTHAPIFKVYAQKQEPDTAVIRSYDDMNRIANNNGSYYVQKPDNFPSAEIDDDDDDDDDDYDTTIEEVTVISVHKIDLMLDLD